MKNFYLCAVAICFYIISPSLLAKSIHDNEKDTSNNFYIKPIVGVSVLSDQTFITDNLLEQTGSADIELNNGLNLGLGAGYRFNDSVVLELAWEYRTNDSNTTLNNGATFAGNYASSLFSANAYYTFFRYDNIDVYAGTGLIYVQEIDLDLEDSELERSLSGNGSSGMQFMIGTRYQLAKSWYLQAQLRHISVSNMRLDAEENLNTGSINNLSYKPLSFELAVAYWF
jgi:outer membrane protein W